MKSNLICYDDLCVYCPKCKNSVTQSDNDARHKVSGYGFTFHPDKGDTFTCDNCAGQLCIAQYTVRENTTFETDQEGFQHMLAWTDQDITIEFYPLVHASNLKLAAQELWDKFSNIPVNNDDEIETAFEHFPIGTCRFDVWHWFENKFNISIINLEGIYT